jgi:hypothetical protein
MEQSTGYSAPALEKGERQPARTKFNNNDKRDFGITEE